MVRVGIEVKASDATRRGSSARLLAEHLEEARIKRFFQRIGTSLQVRKRLSENLEQDAPWVVDRNVSPNRILLSKARLHLYQQLTRTARLGVGGDLILCGSR